MYKLNRSFNIPSGIFRTFDAFFCPGGKEFDDLSLPEGGAFDHHSYLIACLDFMSQVSLIPRGLINYGGDDGDKL